MAGGGWRAAASVCGAGPSSGGSTWRTAQRQTVRQVEGARRRDQHPTGGGTQHIAQRQTVRQAVCQVGGDWRLTVTDSTRT